ncbi:cytochrome P450 [Armillaria novae-zelandiae]|uniref:Cytochrome P450 n=1 Tax=Armillaria novae-zelandiae TaxID=153914 RepID=A0AA39NU90_9AGAR|nr:cytochrome P450 [Armillaria novae-zelandiae]
MDTILLLGIATVFLIILQLRKALITRSKLKAIPTIGSSGIITSWIDAFKFTRNAKEIIQEGHKKHHGSVFKVPLLYKWMVVVSGPEKINDIRKSTREQLSSVDAFVDDLQTDRTVGPCVGADNYLAEVVRGTLNRNISNCFADVQDEMKAAFMDNVPMTEDWIEVPAYERILQIICRASNRMFIGFPLCRDPDYLKLNIDFTIDVFVRARIINFFPGFLKPFVASIVTPRRRAMAKAEKFLGQTIQERLYQEKIYGKDWPGKPNDMLSWLIDGSNGNEERRTIQSLCTRMLFTNLGAIHTTSNAFTTALYVLAAHPEYVETLRTEVESVLKEEGSTKAAMGKMNQLDSFLKECQRLYGDFGVFVMNRVARKEFVFSDGTAVPAGSHIAVAALGTHLDEENYEDPLEFKPWRFSEKRKEEGESIRHQMTTPSLNYVFFGHGRSTCPGRFFAVNELKALMSYVLMNFDVKMDKVPPSMWFSGNQFPDHSSQVLFRKRI